MESESVYIFLYSERDQTFESTIQKACTHYSLFDIRARYTIDRDVKMYTFLSTEKEVVSFNKLIHKDEGETVLKCLSKRTLIVQ